MTYFKTHKKPFLAGLIIICLALGGFCVHMFYENSAACKTDNAVISIGSSTKFSEHELQSAKDCVINRFKSLKSCTLTKLWYEEDRSNRQVVGYMSGGRGSQNGVKSENVIVLYSDFKTGSKAGDQGLNPNSTYKDWNWILIRDSKAGNWRVDDCGY